MAINLDGLTRAKLDPTVSLSATVAVGTIVETDTVGEESFFIPINMGIIDPSAFAVAAVTTTSGQNIVTTINNGFANVSVADVIIADGIPVNSTVTAKTNDNSIVISSNATATATLSVSFDPPSITPTLLAIKIGVEKSGSAITLKPTIHNYNGSLRGSIATALNSTKTIELTSAVIDLDSFLSNCRIARTNS
jgi:hypothetical protein